MKYVAILILAFGLTGCAKKGAMGGFKQLVGDWAQINLPEGCKAHQISADSHGGVSVLCEDGRVFH